VLQLFLLGGHNRDGHRLALETLGQQVLRQVGVAEEGHQGAAQQAVLVLRLRSPGGDHVMQVEPDRLAPLDGLVLVALDLPHRLRLAQLDILAYVVQEEIERRPVEPRRPLSLGQVELDVDVAVLDRYLADEELAQDLV
jgi:hypothetical protein